MTPTSNTVARRRISEGVQLFLELLAALLGLVALEWIMARGLRWSGPSSIFWLLSPMIIAAVTGQRCRVLNKRPSSLETATVAMALALVLALLVLWLNGMIVLNTFGS